MPKVLCFEDRCPYNTDDHECNKYATELRGNKCRYMTHLLNQLSRVPKHPTKKPENKFIKK